MFMINDLQMLLHQLQHRQQHHRQQQREQQQQVSITQFTANLLYFPFA